MKYFNVRDRRRKELEEKLEELMKRRIRTKVADLWWECPKCGSKVKFGEELYILFDKEDSQSWFDAEF